VINGWVNCDMQPTWSRMSPSYSGCYFTPSRWTPQTDETRRLRAKRLAQDGIDSAAAAADQAVEGWTGVAFGFLRKFAEENRGKQYTGYQIVEASKRAGVQQPPNDKAWGQPIQKAARVGVIKRVGYTDDPNRHGNPVPLWETA
jgi:hypothetical protein